MNQSLLIITFLAGVDPVSSLRTSSTSSELTVRAAGSRYPQPAPSQTSPSGSRGRSSSTSAAAATTKQTRATPTRSCSARGTCWSTPLLWCLVYVRFLSSNQYSIIHFQKILSPAMTCDEDPDKGDNSAVEAYIWDNSKIFSTNITITCPVGKLA